MLSDSSFVYFYTREAVDKIMDIEKHYIKGVEIECRVLTQRHEKFKSKKEGLLED